jgi:type IV secretory pathway component VirB8
MSTEKQTKLTSTESKADSQKAKKERNIEQTESQESVEQAEESKLKQILRKSQNIIISFFLVLTIDALILLLIFILYKYYAKKK